MLIFTCIVPLARSFNARATQQTSVGGVMQRRRRGGMRSEESSSSSDGRRRIRQFLRVRVIYGHDDYNIKSNMAVFYRDLYRYRYRICNRTTASLHRLGRSCII